MLIFDFLVGLAIFLYGMHELERGIRKLSDARLRYWLRSSTGTTLGSVTTGIFTTALLQSSSMVSLMTLAFAAAGVLPLVNSVGIILGANLGTTITGWIVATLGFKLNLEAISLPLFGMSAAVIVLLGRIHQLRYTAMAALGLGLLLFGLGLMKESMDTLPEVWNVSRIQGQPAIIYLLLGLLLAALIQSSSAAMMMALAALNAGILSLPEAVAFVIGADLGTTSTTALGSLFGGAIKKQLAAAHFLFNLVVDAAAFVVLLPLLPWLLDRLPIQDPLYSLVAFHTAMNLLGLLAFIPVITQFTNFLTRHIGNSEAESDGAFAKVPAEISDAAIAALDQAVTGLVSDAAVISTRVVRREAGEILQVGDKSWVYNPQQGFKDNYENLKRAEAEVLRYALQIQAQPLPPEHAVAVDKLLSTTRSAVYAVKTLKDIRHDLDELRYGDNHTMESLYASQRSYIVLMSTELTELLSQEQPVSLLEEKLQEMRSSNDQHQDEMNRFVHTHGQTLFADKSTLSTELNVNREIHHWCKALINAIQSQHSRTDGVSEIEKLVNPG